MTDEDLHLSSILHSSEELDLYNNVDVKSVLELLQQDPVLLNDQNPLFVNQGIQDYYPPVNEVVRPPPPPPVITNEDYAGPLNFEVFFDPHHGLKNRWVYSSELRKVFIPILNPFPVDFKWSCKYEYKLFVRAMPLYSLSEHVQDIVSRCIPHAQEQDSSNLNMPGHVWDHVIRCINADAAYQGNKEEGQRLSVVVPLGLPQSGTDTVRRMYQFVCKNSCPSGMNRRPFEVIFTLEDERGEVLGRSKVNVRVCSCPKRDKEKEEKEYVKKQGHNDPPHGKKRKLDKKLSQNDAPLDTKQYSLNMKITGKQTFLKILENIKDAICGDIISHGVEAPFKDSLNYVENLKST